MSLLIELSAVCAGAEALPDAWTTAESLVADSEWRSAAAKWDDDEEWDEEDDWEDDDEEGEEDDDDEGDDEEDDQDDW